MSGFRDSSMPSNSAETPILVCSPSSERKVTRPRVSPVADRKKFLDVAELEPEGLRAPDEEEALDRALLVLPVGRLCTLRL